MGRGNKCAERTVRAYVSGLIVVCSPARARYACKTATPRTQGHGSLVGGRFYVDFTRLMHIIVWTQLLVNHHQGLTYTSCNHRRLCIAKLMRLTQAQDTRLSWALLG